MKTKDFRKYEQRYVNERTRFQSINNGDLVWLQGNDTDLHPAVVTGVNVDENYVDVIDVSLGNERKRYTGFLTAQELLKDDFTWRGINEEVIKQERDKYKDVIKSAIN